MKVSTFLRKARALIRKGWTQEKYEEVVSKQLRNGKEVLVEVFCIVGATEAVLESYKLSVSPIDLQYCEVNAVEKNAHRFLRASLPKGHRNVIRYNDTQGRTQKQVVALFDRAITKALKAEARGK